MIKVLFFANLRDAAKTDSYEVSAEGIANVRELVRLLNQRLSPDLAAALSDETAMVSVDHKYAGWDAELSDGAEVGFLPPVSGG